MDYQEVLRLADKALYEAKREGRNRAIGWLSADPKEAVEWLRNASAGDKLNPPTRKVVTLGPSEQFCADALISNHP
jgi:hypothetical protein